MSILKKRHEVRKSDMNILTNSNIEFDYAGLFQTKEGWIHPRRVERTYELIYVTRGEVYMREEAREIHAREGELFLLSPGLCHEGTRKTEDVAFYWVHFRLPAGELPFSKRFFEGLESAYLFKELLHFNNLPQVPEYLVNAVLVHILAELCRMADSDTVRYHERAERIYEWIRINADAELTVGAVARHFGYSPDHLSRLCRKCFGVGAGELIDRFLLARIKTALVNTGKYVKEIAADLHFTSDKALIGFFKYHEGSFPSAFRERFGRVHMNNR